jgi:GAF domain-containing protein
VPAAPPPANETERYSALMGYHLRQGVLGDATADALVHRAVWYFHTQQSAIALVGRSTVYFVAAEGAPFHTLPRDLSFCGYAIHGNKPLVVPDATLDLRFSDNPLVTGPPFVRFYAGAPLVDRDGYSLGTFCIVDTKPHSLATEEIGELVGLSELAMRRIDFLATVAELFSYPDAGLLV